MVDSVGPIQSPQPLRGVDRTQAEGSEKKAQVSFKEILKKSIQQVNELQHEADQAIQDLMLGKRDDFAGVITAVKKADIAFRTLMQVRNKLIDAYQEFNRMRV